MVIPKMGGHPPTHFFPSLDLAELKRANKGEQGFSLLPTSVKLPAVTLLQLKILPNWKSRK
jgi:hypothetical protein